MAKAALLGPGGPPSPGSEGGEHPRFYVLPRRYLPLGAYPVGEWRVHRTHRHGPRAFTHSEFSRLRREGKPPKGGDLQLHTWEYLLAEEFLGAVLAEKEEDLRRLQGLVGYGAKLGKEGFAYLRAVGEPLEVRLEEGDAPFTPVRAEAWGGAIQGAYPLYRFRFGEAEDPDPASPDPSPVIGYEGAYFVLPVGGAWPKVFPWKGGFSLGIWWSSYGRGHREGLLPKGRGGLPAPFQPPGARGQAPGVVAGRG